MPPSSPSGPTSTISKGMGLCEMRTIVLIQTVTTMNVTTPIEINRAISVLEARS